jgi:hypothetical protein
VLINITLTLAGSWGLSELDTVPLTSRALACNDFLTGHP